jgi:SpoVK/Ycf46/Vps4 family AAA+-type ATPase
VKSATDRYANLETNYLLQRLETYQGVIIVTTNAGEHIDTAFQRRMDVVVNFVPPQAAERWRIWRLHLPPGHAVEDVFLEEIAQRCVLSGGQIRNAALHATLLSLDDGTAVRRAHVVRAIESEYRKAGATSTLGETSRPASSDSSIRGFINALST